MLSLSHIHTHLVFACCLSTSMYVPRGRRLCTCDSSLSHQHLEQCLVHGTAQNILVNKLANGFISPPGPSNSSPTAGLVRDWSLRKQKTRTAGPWLRCPKATGRERCSCVCPGLCKSPPIWGRTGHQKHPAPRNAMRRTLSIFHGQALEAPRKLVPHPDLLLTPSSEEV